MKTIKVLMMFFLMGLSLVPAAFSYTIDGNVDDWGVNLATADATHKNYLDINTPSGGPNVDYVTEDNADQYDGTVYVGPGYSIGNQYDAEAMYLNNDYQYLYLAIVTGVSPSELAFPAGDIFFDAGIYQDPLSSLFDSKKYSFGIDVQTGQFYAVNSWQNVAYAAHSAANPWKMGADKTFIGNVDFIYTPNAVNSHYVMETKIPLAFLDLSGNSQHDIWAHWTMLCGNDNLNLQGDIDGNPVPEPATMSLMLLGSVGMGWMNRKKVGA